jgi:histidyl-tRNA synthetase
MELSPDKQVVFDDMIDKIKKVFKQSCFMPIDTPVLELSEILLAKSGGSIDKELYHFKKGDTDICMRYDLTVPLARYVAMNAETLSFPFKRYQIGKVYRGEKPQKGRFRELYQCDADIIGNENLPIPADAECIELIDKAFKELNVHVITHISNRNILFGLCEALGLEKETSEILIILDKINKIGRDNAKEELLKLGVKEKDAATLIDITLKCGDFDSVLKEIENITDNECFQKGISELRELSGLIKVMHIDGCVLDIGIIRGQNYYTGTVFEAVCPAHPEFGTVCGGGRYDNLAGYFTEKKLPGVGMSIGLTRLFDLLDNNDMLPPHPLSTTKLCIIPLGETLNHCFELCAYFKDNGINCEVNYSERSFKAKLKDANKREIPFVLIVGENEVASGAYNLKNMQTGEQFTLSKEKCLMKLNVT